MVKDFTFRIDSFTIIVAATIGGIIAATIGGIVAIMVTSMLTGNC